MRARDYRKMAAENCDGYAAKLALVTLIDMALMEADFFIGGPIKLGKAEINKKLYEKKDFAIYDLFSQFVRFGAAFGANAFMTLFIFLWGMLFIIPGIIKQFSYSMTFYIMQDDQSLHCKDAITESRKLMNGHKWELFCLDFSYIGWLLLVVLTWGVLGLWVFPKMEQAHYCFYRHITNQDNVTIVE